MDTTLTTTNITVFPIKGMEVTREVMEATKVTGVSKEDQDTLVMDKEATTTNLTGTIMGQALVTVEVTASKDPSKGDITMNLRIMMSQIIMVKLTTTIHMHKMTRKMSMIIIMDHKGPMDPKVKALTDPDRIMLCQVLLLLLVGKIIR